MSDGAVGTRKQHSRVTPLRLQLPRCEGFDLQRFSLAVNGLTAVQVTDSGFWGNPLQLEGADIFTALEAQRKFRLELLVRLSKDPDMLEPLRKKNLACWCEHGKPCYAEILLKIANQKRFSEQS